MAKGAQPQERSAAVVAWGNAADLQLLKDDEANLVITSPPYFSAATEKLLRAPRSEQLAFEQVEQEVTEFALSLRPAFEEIARVLRPGGAFVLQTKCIRYGGFLVALADLHREMASHTGLRLVTSVSWLPVGGLERKPTSFQRAPRVGTFRAASVDEFCVFAHPQGIDRGSSLDLGEGKRPGELVLPLWRVPSGHQRDRHPFGSPPAVVRRFIELFSEPDDLVVDPFAGYGTMLVEARRLGRRSLGYNLDRDCIERAQHSLEALP